MQSFDPSLVLDASTPNDLILDAVDHALVSGPFRHSWALAKPLGDLRRWRGARAG